MSKDKCQVISAVEVVQHSCFCYEDEDVVVTVYSKRKKRMRAFEVNTYLDLAKAKIIDRIRGYD